ncbi:ABC transporter ATP-binding protein [Roseomonas sp. CCTCC AB2023176]|uniref:ABC transporter ATP-binding protein n=1 Tax=Roseomonas sp. CCTCC AB2023176 TaxID=3342640 RepID=UPI0035D8FD87
MSAEGLVLSGVEAGYPGGGRVLFGVDLVAPLGAAVSLIGRNGMGKTTTVRTVMGMLRPLGGTIRFAGREIGGERSFRIARAGLGLVPEGRRVFPSLSVEENLAATARPGPWTMARVLRLFPQLEARRNSYARTLSGGEQQMLAVGRAVLTNPRLLILDEATEGLAPLIRAEIWGALQVLKTEGLGVVVIDKNLREMAHLVDRHHVLEKGRVVWTGTSAELAGDRSLAERALGV